MKRIAIVYSSKHGSAEAYALWIGSRLSADILESEDTSPDALSRYDIIIYGGGIYADKIRGIGLIKKAYPFIKGKDLIIYAVGMSDPRDEDNNKILWDKNFTQDMQSHMRLFRFTGSLRPENLGFFEKKIVNAMKKSIEGKDESKRTEQDNRLLALLNGRMKGIDTAQVQPLIEHINALMII